MFEYTKLIERGQGLNAEQFAILLYISDRRHTATRESICNELCLGQDECEEFLKDLEERALISKTDSGNHYWCTI